LISSTQIKTSSGISGQTAFFEPSGYWPPSKAIFPYLIPNFSQRCFEVCQTPFILMIGFFAILFWMNNALGAKISAIFKERTIVPPEAKQNRHQATKRQQFSAQGF
jgi:hypothetical protein